MKKGVICFGLIALMSISLYSGEKAFITLTGGPLMPADSSFKYFYGDVVFYPEIKASYRIYRNLFFWTGYGFFFVRGTTSKLNLEVKTTHHFFSLGAGFTSRIAGKLDYKAECGLFQVNYKERAMGDTRKESDTGIRFDVGVTYNINSRFFSEVSLGCLTAVDDVDGKSLKLGGFRILIGFGVRFL